MTRFVLAAAAATALLYFAAPAGAANHAPVLVTKHERQVIAFFHRRPKLLATPKARLIILRIAYNIKAREPAYRAYMAKRIRDLQAARTALPSGVCASCWDAVASCESGDDWGLVTSNGFYWGLQWVPSTWDAAAARHGLPSFDSFRSSGTYPTREQQITAASDMALSNWPVCGARY